MDCRFVKPLISWWRRTCRERDYIWRTSRDPYRVLVAEVLLQRTRRDKVREVYREFISKFPTVHALASASTKEVEEVTAPLGLKKRALYLIRLARSLLSKRDVMKTCRFEELPGVGPYIASAARVILGINTILYPDSSIARVLSRYFGRPLNQRRPANTTWVIETLRKCAPTDSLEKRSYFLALLDLAWEICKPRRPLCKQCPLAESCNNVT